VTDTLEEKAAEQIKAVCDRSEFADCKIRIMPDVHAGKGCTIGTTMTISDKIVPGMVGVDIGCAEGREQEIADTIKHLKAETKREVGAIPKDLAYVSGQLFDDYIHDMRLIQRFAVLNRQAMTDVILCGMGFTEVDRFTTVHNYIDTESMILRKG
jgi:RNA-splicing ligase RtcB